MPARKERRRRQRVDVALAIKIRYNKHYLSAQTKNISILGTYIETKHRIPVKTTLDIGIRLSRKTKVRAQGIVFRCHPINLAGSSLTYGIGIFFRSFVQRSEQVLANYIDRLLRREQRKGKIYVRPRKQARRKGGK